MTKLTRILPIERFRLIVDQFNRDDDETIVNLISNAQSWEWLAANAPLFDCPDAQFVETCLYRWWTYRKHIKQTPAGKIVTEFISDVRHAGSYNSISCAAAFHLLEGRWLADQAFLDEYTRFWFRMNDGKPEPKFHNYSSWYPAALWDRSLVTGDRSILIELLHDLVADFQAWETEKLLPNGLFWQYDVRDGMEESITGSRKHKNARPTINAYMYANAVAIARVAALAGESAVEANFTSRSETLRRLTNENLWDSQARFYKAQADEGALSDAREAIGFVPWMFKGLVPAAYAEAWRQLPDPAGFWAPCGLTTAERRHPKFRSHGVGKCEWDGAVWPFATSQTLMALSNALRANLAAGAARAHWFEALLTYARSHRKNGRHYVGEYHCELTGEWLKGDNPRSSYYNHSSFNDLVIAGLVGLQPDTGDRLIVDPLLPENGWEWFSLDGVPYHGHSLSVVWDRFGKRFGRGAGLSVLVDGEEAARRDTLGSLEVHVP